MAVTYAKSLRDKAKAESLHLVTLSARGVEFQGAVSADESLAVVAFLERFLAWRRATVRTTRDAVVLPRVEVP